MGRRGKKPRGNAPGAPAQRSVTAQSEAAAERSDDAPRTPFHWRLSDAPLAAAREATLARLVARAQAHMDAAYHAQLASHLRHACTQAVTLGGAQPAQLLAYLDWHRAAQRIPEQWTRVCGADGAAIGFKIGLKKGRRAPDDKLYLQNPDLQENLPRGLVFTRNFPGATGEPNERNDRIDLVLFANRKFYGRKQGDDDDTDVCSAALRDGRFTHFIVSDKANGEAAQLALAPDGETFVIGSKNRKIAAKSRADVDEYASQQCYSFAVEMAECFFEDYWAKMSAELRAEFKDFLSETRYTLNFEFETPAHQHLVPLFKRRMVLIGLTGVHLGTAGGRAAHPCLGAAVARWFGFPSVILDTKLRDKTELDAVCGEIARDWELEGSVLVLLDDEMRVVDLVKVKTWWYIILRATREKMRQLRGRATLAQQCRLIRGRLDTLQRAMRIDGAVIERFKELTVAFASWMISDQNVDNVGKDFVRRAQSDEARKAVAVDGGKSLSRLERFHQGQYPLLWRQFLEDAKLPYGPELLSFDLPTAIAAAEQAGALEERPSPLLVMLQGIPGLGKSALAVATSAELNKAGTQTTQLAQDDFAHLGQKKSGGACQARVVELLETNGQKVVLLARNNANRQQYQRYTALNQDGLCRMVFLAPEELASLGTYPTADAVPESLFKLVYMCVASVLHRKASSDDSHPTDSMTRTKLAKLPFTFLRFYEQHPAALTVPFMADGAPMPPAAFCNFVRSALGFGNAAAAADATAMDDDDAAVDGSKQKQGKEKQQKRKKDDDDVNEQVLSDWGLGTAAECAAVVTAAHRPLADLARDAAAAISTRVVDSDLPPIGSYIAAVLTTEASARVADVLGPFPAAWYVHGDHVTMVHSHSYMQHKDKWAALQRQEGLAVRVKPLGMLRNKVDGAGANDAPPATSLDELPALCALRVSVEIDGKSVDALVASGEPHITVATGVGVKAFKAGPAVTKAKDCDGVLDVPAALGELEAVLRVVELN